MANSIDLSTLSADEILYLKAKANYYSVDPHDLSNPVLTDSEFDVLEDQLRLVDSFVVDIVGTIKINGNKATVSKGKIKFIPHKSPMGSLAKIQFKPGYTPYPEFANWLSQIPTNTNIDIEFGTKLDGNAINTTYENGKLISVTSRGDGQEGQDYTAAPPSGIPTFIKDFTGEIRGEAVIDTYVFDSKYKKDGIDPLKKYTNARNYVAGALAHGDKIKCNEIDFVAFQIVDYVGVTFTQLIKWGFNVLDYTKVHKVSEINDILFQSIHDGFATYRENCKYQLDGIVAKMDESIRATIGQNNHHPHWALAIKFIAEEVSTKITGIEWTLGKRGQLTPVALLEAVQLMGSTVRRASLYNASWMIANKCFDGATVSLIKSGDIIPKIVKVLTPSSNVYALPTKWNGKPVTFDGVNLMLTDFESTNEFKSIKLSNSIIALGIKEVGPAMCTRLISAGLTFEFILDQTPMGLKMVLLQSGEFKPGRELDLLIENMFALTKVELWQVIYACGFRNCGKTISKQLANYMTGITYSFVGLEKVVVDEFINGSKQQAEVKRIVGILLTNNVNIIKPQAQKAGIITYTLTGSPSSGHATKADYIREVEASNKCKEVTLAKDTNYLVTNSKASMTTKMQKAEKNGTKIVDYTEFLNIINSL